MVDSHDLVNRLNVLEKDILATKEQLNLIVQMKRDHIIHEDGILHRMERRQVFIILISAFALISQLLEFAFFKILQR